LAEFIGRIEYPKAFQKSCLSFPSQNTPTSHCIRLKQLTQLLHLLSPCTPVRMTTFVSGGTPVAHPHVPSYSPTWKGLHLLDYGNSPGLWRDDMDGIQWLELLQPFTTVKDYTLARMLSYVGHRHCGRLLGKEATEAMPVQENIFGSQRLCKGLLGCLSPHENSPVTLWSSTVGSEGDNMTGDVYSTSCLSPYQLLLLSASIHAVLCPSILQLLLPTFSSFGPYCPPYP